MKRYLKTAACLLFFFTAVGAEATSYRLTAELRSSSLPERSFYLVSGWHAAAITKVPAFELPLPWALEGMLFKNGKRPVRFPFFSHELSCTRSGWNRHSVKYLDCGVNFQSTNAQCASRIAGSWQAYTEAGPNLADGIVSEITQPPRWLSCRRRVPPRPDFPSPGAPGCLIGATAATTRIDLGTPQASAEVLTTSPQRLYRTVQDSEGPFITDEWLVLEGTGTPVRASSDAAAVAPRFGGVGSMLAERAGQRHLLVRHPIHVDNGRGHMPLVELARGAHWEQLNLGVQSGTVALRMSFSEGRERSIQTVFSDLDLNSRESQWIADGLQISESHADSHRFSVYLVLDVTSGRVTPREPLVTLPQCCCLPDQPLCQ